MGFDTILQILIQGLNMGLIYALAALGISLIWNATGLFNFAQGDLLTMGGFVMLSTVRPLGAAVSPCLCAHVRSHGPGRLSIESGLFFPMFSQGLHPDIIIIGTVALTVLIQNGILLLWGPHPQRFSTPLGDRPVHFGQIIIMPYYLWNIVIVLVLVAVLQCSSRRASLGSP